MAKNNTETMATAKKFIKFSKLIVLFSLQLSFEKQYTVRQRL